MFTPLVLSFGIFHFCIWKPYVLVYKKHRLSSLLTMISYFYIKFTNFWYTTCFSPIWLRFCTKISIYFQMFCSKHSITFENTHLLKCWFHHMIHCFDIFYIKFRFYETFSFINSVTRTYCDSNKVLTHNHLIRKKTLNHFACLAKLLSVRLRIKWLWGFEFRCCHINFRYRAFFEQDVPWHSDNYRV